MFKIFKAKTVLFALVSSLLFSACNTKNIEEKNIVEKVVLENNKFQALELNNITVKNGEKVAFISFESDSKIHGNLGCNNFFGSYKVNKNELTLGQVGSTMMMCQNMDTERNFLDVLQNTKTYKLENNILELYNQNGENIARFRKE